MTLEIWTIVAALSLVTGAMAGGLAMFRLGPAWDRMFLAARAISTTGVTVALVGSLVAQGGWSPQDPAQSALGLVLVMLILQWVLAWRFKTRNVGPLVESVGLGLLLLGAIDLQTGAPLLNCQQEMALFQIQWALFLLGGASLLLAACMGLTLALGKVLQGLSWDLSLAAPADLYALVVQAAMLAVVALGGGLIVSLWWSWQTLGTLTSGDPREGWMALIWLLTAMSLLAGQLPRHRRRWVVGLAVLAAANVLFAWPLLAGAQGVLGI